MDTGKKKEKSENDESEQSWYQPDSENSKSDDVGDFVVDARVSEALSSSPLDPDMIKQTSLIKRGKQNIMEWKDNSNETKEGKVVPDETAPEDPFLRWWKHHKHFFVLSSSGRPIYSRHGDESILASFVPFFAATLAVVETLNDNMKHIIAGKHRIVFLVKGPIILVSIADTMEPVSLLIQQLNYIYSEVISILTSGVSQLLERKTRFDLRKLLGGADTFLNHLTYMMDHDTSILFNSFQCLRLSESIREKITNVITQAKTPELFYALLVAKHQIVTLVCPKKYFLQPSDIHLILNFVNSSTSLRTAESWAPLCLPKFNDQGFLHAHVSFLANDLCLLLMSTKQNSFYELNTCKNVINQSLSRHGLIDQVGKAMLAKPYKASELGIESLLHFTYKSSLQKQFTSPSLEAPYNSRHQQKKMYQRAYKRLNQFETPHKVIYQTSSSETMIAWRTRGFELIATFGPLESKSLCLDACNSILKWIKGEESSLFIIDKPTW